MDIFPFIIMIHLKIYRYIKTLYVFLLLLLLITQLIKAFRIKVKLENINSSFSEFTVAYDKKKDRK